MIDKLIAMLKQNKEVSAYKIVQSDMKSIELFYVLQSLETNRATNTTDVIVTVYKDFEDFRGSANFSYNAFLTQAEVEEKIKEALYRASFVKNTFYELPKCEVVINEKSQSNISNKALVEYAPEVVEAIFKADCFQQGYINSTEIFFYHTIKHIVNSNGVDAKYDVYKLMVEVIPTWKKGNEEFELYKSFEHGEVHLKRITSEVNEILDLAKARSEAKTIAAGIKCKVILQDEEVADVFTAFVRDLNYQNVYQNMSLSELNKSVQENATGDLINITLTPNLVGSVLNAPVDAEGVELKDVNIIEDGVAKSFHGDNRFGYYLKEKNITGNMVNIIANAGKKSFEEMTSEPYILCVKFSGMQMDYYSGFFGGEVRLGFYYDGQTVTPVSGFSVSGNIHESKKIFRFSSEEIIINTDYIGYKGPKYIEITDMVIA